MVLLSPVSRASAGYSAIASSLSGYLAASNGIAFSAWGVIGSFNFMAAIPSAVASAQCGYRLIAPYDFALHVRIAGMPKVEPSPTNTSVTP